MNRRSTRIFTAVVMFLLLVLSLQSARASTWIKTQIDNTATTTGQKLSMAVDPDGKLYIGYLDTGGTTFLKYAYGTNTGNASSWTIENLTDILPYAYNVSTSTVFTPGGPRVMAYSYNGTLGKYMYRAARKVTGDGWQLQDIAGGISPLDGAIQLPAMTQPNSATQTGAVQYMGFTFITYNNGTYLSYANERDMEWHDISAPGYAAGNGGTQSDLAVDSTGNVHVIYVDYNKDLYYKKNPTAAGQAVSIKTHAHNGIANPSIGIGSDNKIHIIYTDPTSNNGSVYYTYSTDGGNTWSASTTVGTCGKNGGYTALKVDSANNVHVVWYSNSGTSGLIYREKPSTTLLWTDAPAQEQVNANGQYAQMAIDQYNNVNIAYYNDSTTSLDIATKATASIDVSPSTMFFGYVPTNPYPVPTQTVTISNKGTNGSNLTINSISAPSPATYFTEVSRTCGTTLAVGASCTVTYQFNPTVTGAQTATVSIGSNDPNFPDTNKKTVLLKGTATSAANHTIMAGVYGAGGTISPAGPVSVADSVNQTFTITPDPGYIVAAVSVDPVFAYPNDQSKWTQQEFMAASNGMLNSYTFSEVIKDHAIYVMFMPYAAVSAWSTAQVDNASYTGRNLSIAVDPDNKLHIGYLESAVSNFTNPYLKYANNTGGSWVTENLTNILPYAMNASTSTVFTPGGPRIMAYSYNSTLGKYMYRAARKVTGDGWQLQDIGGGISPLDGSLQPAMTQPGPTTQTGALQYDGFTFITFNNGNYLQYANERDMAWYQISNAGAAVGNGGSQSDLAIDSSGNVHVVYVDALNNLMYGLNPKNPGEATTLIDTDGTISNPNIVLGANNTLHVVYLDVKTTSPTRYNVMYITHDANGWSTPRVVGPCGAYGGNVALKADNIGGIHISYYYSTSSTNSTGLLMYHHRLASGSWGSEEVIKDPNSSASYGQYSAIAIDHDNIVNIAYYDVTNSSLKVATKQTYGIETTPPTLYFGNVLYGSTNNETVTVTNRGTSGNLKIRGSATISGANASEFSITTNACANGLAIAPGAAGCNVTVLFTPNDTPGAKTANLIIGSDDLQLPYKTVPLSGTSLATASYTITAGTTGPGGTISPAGYVSVTGSGSQTFTITPDPGYIVVMVAVDPTGMTQPEMMAASKGAITSYTFNQVTANHGIYVMFMPYVSVSTWTTALVDNAAYTGRNCSIAVDPNNKLHIGYLQSAVSGFTSPFLKYATDATGSWVASSLQYILPNAMNASTATVYTPGGPRIMAYSYDSATLEYKYQAARMLGINSWQLQDIGGGVNPMTGVDEPAMTAVSTATQTGALQYMGFTFITFNNGNYLQYANERDMKWYPISTSGSSAGNGGTQSDLTIDAAGNIHVVYVDALNNLMYGLNPKNPGEATTIKDTTGVISNPNIAIDTNNTLHLIYQDSTGASGVPGVMYMNKPSGGAWSTPRIVGPIGTKGGYLNIKADNTGGIHICYYYSNTTTTGLLMYQHILPSGAWGSEEIIKDLNNSTNYGQYAAMAIDNNNIVNIAYYDAATSGTNTTSLKIARKQTFGINASPSPLYFGNVAQGSSDDNTVTVTNKGTAGTLKIRGSAAISGANASEFMITGNTCYNGLQIAPGDAGCTVTVHYAPTTPGAKTADLIIGSDDLLIPYKSVPLSGTSNTPVNYTITAGVAGVGGTISPAGPVTVAGSASKTFTITPDPGYLVAFVSIDPQGMTKQDLMAASQGALASYTFDQVAADHSIFVVFMQAIPVTSWNITQVDNTGTTGTYCSITNDANGKLHVGYLESTNILKYATNKSGTWAFETVSVIPSITAAGTATVFSEGVGPRVMAYSYNSSTGARKYGAARKWTETPMPGGNLNDWQLQWIAGDYFDPPNNTMPQYPIYNTTTDTFTGATQFGGYTFITYTDGNNLWYANEKDMFYLKLDPSGTVAGAGKQSDLVLDPAGNIHIIYYTPITRNGHTGELRYGTGQGSNSSGYTEDPPLVTGTSSDPSITIDGNKMLHVSYIQNNNVMYMNKPFGGSWSTPITIGPCGANGQYTSIKANGLNIVHLTYYAYNLTNASGKLMYVTRSAEGLWSAPQAVTDTVANFGQYAALTVDMHHNVNIAYYDVTNSSLKVAARLIPVISGPTQKDFGTISSGGEAFQTITISNLGQSDLKIGTVTKNGANPDNFEIISNTCNGAVLKTGGAGCSVVVRFSATAAGPYTSNFHITSNDRYTADLQVALSGTVSGTPTFAITTSVNAAVGTHGYINPGGTFNVPSAGNQCFNFIKDPGFFISDVKVDNVTNATAVTNGYHCFTNVTAPHTLDVIFESFIKVGTYFIGTLQAALLDAATYETPIKARTLTFTEYLVYQEPTLIILGGGYDSAFSAQNGITVIKGTLEIRDGGIEVQNIGLTP